MELPEFRAECFAFAGHDDKDIRIAALFGLDSYGLRSGDYELASFFLEAVTDENRHYRESRIAVLAIPRILEGNLPEFIAAAANSLRSAAPRKSSTTSCRGKLSTNSWTDIAPEARAELVAIEDVQSSDYVRADDPKTRVWSNELVLDQRSYLDTDQMTTATLLDGSTMTARR